MNGFDPDQNATHQVIAWGTRSKNNRWKMGAPLAQSGTKFIAIPLMQ
jgi:hypothetical protein